MITTHSLRIDYENLTAVHDLDLKIYPGQIYGLVGPNGAGKTSTIKAIAGIIEPTYGEIKIGNVDLELQPQEALKQLGYMPDFSPVYENLKVWEYLDVFAIAYKIEGSARYNRVHDWLKKVNLDSKAHTLIRELSRGMRQRLVLAKTLLPEPSVLLLDEPASGMDPMARMDLWNTLKETASQGTTILISSHILTELSDFCTAIGIMEKGRMVVSGTINEIRAQIGSQGQLFVRLVDPQETARITLRNILSACPFLKEITEVTMGTFQANFYGNDQEAVLLLKQLVHDGLPITDFHIREENVEDIFFKVGAREVS